jgi:hypothetical protein
VMAVRINIHLVAPVGYVIFKGCCKVASNLLCSC